MSTLEQGIIGGSVVGKGMWNPMTVLEDRRNGTRFPKSAMARLVGPGSGQSFSCSLKDMSEGGMFVLAPLESRLCVGQRYQITLAQESSGLPSGIGMEDELFATVVRTERLSGGKEHGVGAGMRFDHPLYL